MFLFKGCFSDSLNPEFRALIDAYRRDFEALQEYCDEVLEGVSFGVSWKAHILVCHLPQWLDKHSEGMAKYAEQTAEAIHCDFSKTYKRFKRDESHPEHGKRLLRSAVEYSSRRI